MSAEEKARTIARAPTVKPKRFGNTPIAISEPLTRCSIFSFFDQKTKQIRLKINAVWK
jgi:hypothetical protein